MRDDELVPEPDHRDDDGAGEHTADRSVQRAPPNREQGHSEDGQIEHPTLDLERRPAGLIRSQRRQ